jgi:hypothetical protein
VAYVLDFESKNRSAVRSTHTNCPLWTLLAAYAMAPDRDAATDARLIAGLTATGAATRKAAPPRLRCSASNGCASNSF